MAFPQILVWLVGLSCATLFVQSLVHAPRYQRTWPFLTAFILVMIPVLLLIVPDFAAWILLSLWLGVIVLPLMGFAWVQRRVTQGHYRRARRLAQLLAWIHPGDGWREYPQLILALEEAQAGNLTRAQEILMPFQDKQHPLAFMAIALLYRLENRWSDLLVWFEKLPAGVQGRQNMNLYPYYLRALAETGRFDLFFPELERIIPQTITSQDPQIRNTIHLFALAFTGQVQILSQLLQGPLRQSIPQEAHQFWLATATMTAGDLKSAQESLQRLTLGTRDLSLLSAIQWRLEHPLPKTHHRLSPKIQTALSQLTQGTTEAQRYTINQISQGQSWLSWLLIILNLGVFGLQLFEGFSLEPELTGQFGNQTNLEVLYELGALWPESVQAGEYWRLVSANFLHGGTIHLLMNMAGLAFLGPFVERSLGEFRFLVIYAGSGLGAMGFLAYGFSYLGLPPQFTVGASGAIMGIVGAIAAIMLWGWLVERAAIAAKRFRSVLFIIGLQIAFDFSAKNVSIAGHLSGLTLGFLITLGLLALQHLFGGRLRSIRKV
jgi:rhomboid protease GluP